MMLTNYMQRRQGLKNGTREPDPKKEKTPMRRQSEKAKAKEGEDKKLFAADKEFYADIWNASPHVCYECGKKLGKEPLTLFFHHLLPKSHYPEFRHTPENIAILCPDDHQQAETDLDKVPRVKARREEVYKTLINNQ